MTFSLTRALLLHLLTEPRYGQQLSQLARLAARGRVRLGAGALYPALARLERQGFLRAWTVSGRPGRPRKYYELTARGGREAQAAREAVMAALAARTEPPEADAAMEDRMKRSLTLGARAREAGEPLGRS